MCLHNFVIHCQKKNKLPHAALIKVAMTARGLSKTSAIFRPKIIYYNQQQALMLFVYKISTVEQY